MNELWPLIHAERAALAEDLVGLTEEQWRHPTLSTAWTVEEVVAHLTAGASTGPWAWIRSILGAHLDPALHNERRLAEHLGPTPARTLERFRAVVDSTTAPLGSVAAWLAEVVIYGEDIRVPLGLRRRYPEEVLATVLDHLESSNFTVPSKARARGLTLVATDLSHWAGAGPEVRGTALDLVLALAGRPVPPERFSGPGADDLDTRGHGPSQRR
ncbi:maleylpyruvate isomerase family mycothiol-dependent enzyme [Citricoccus sp. SGAir0253]|uniref:maleylpyruvate isomerase family mycothiol-dependent enzyme n=1 Tax=Citricoccus sp. SGAir0253 TaxID=2567881 RepID=UPI0010CCDACA|nr:maleylpyruvate isomerase family mycothiol-dependent enzyme [Citricoccus sp. SGAir0253]QCU79127.1 maleylpyruvate isomerase family mycothiol-dependent enzyme [Citricoccus sp. SGAir0253]